ncbi:MAG: serine protease [Chloroflexota bacterium]
MWADGKQTSTAVKWLVMALLLAGLACSSLPQAIGPSPLMPSPTTAVSATPLHRPVSELALATVQVLAMVRQGGQFSPVWSGSGSIITPDGLILTNAHVVDDRYDEYTHLGVAVLKQTDRPPELRYLAEIAAVDYGLDLAVIRIVSDLNGSPVSLNLSTIAIGDSDEVEIGDPLQILGYPGIGGETITFTEGAVSGFTSDRLVDGRAWIKTDATIAGGNSGGTGANAAGELIGVPTTASSGAEEGEVVDCRPVVDTNRDGQVDDRDTCVPIGGFINGLRPVNLALPLIEAALSGAVYHSGVVSQVEPAGGYDLSQTRFFHLAFADGVTPDDRPTRLLPALPTGTVDACAFWDYEGMIDGMTWSAYWFVDGEPSEGGSIVNASWVGGDQGNWWVCIHDDLGLADGLYELVLEVEGEALAADAVFVGGQHPTVRLTVINDTTRPACCIQISPSLAQNWGPDDLGETEIVYPGASRLFEVPAGQYDLRALDCDFNRVAQQYRIDIAEDITFALSSAP